MTITVSSDQWVNGYTGLFAIFIIFRLYRYRKNILVLMDIIKEEIWYRYRVCALGMVGSYQACCEWLGHVEGPFWHGLLDGISREALSWAKRIWNYPDREAMLEQAFRCWEAPQGPIFAPVNGDIVLIWAIWPLSTSSPSSSSSSSP